MRSRRGRGSVAPWAVVGVLLGGLLGGCTDAGAGSGPSGTGEDGAAASVAANPAEASTGHVDEEAPPRSVWLTFEDLQPGDLVTAPVNGGDLPVTVDVVSLGGGEVRGERGPRRGAARLPAWDADDPAYAILRARGTGPDDVLSPGEADFVFGADFTLDDVSSGTPADNGDNLVQRGLFEGPAQYKLQVDHHELSCRVAGMAGDVITDVPVRVRPGTWYRARCLRQGDDVTLMIAEVLPGRELGEWTTATDSGPIGPVDMPRPTPMSVGGKLALDGSLYPGSTDQLNGVVDRVVYRLLDPLDER